MEEVPGSSPGSLIREQAQTPPGSVLVAFLTRRDGLDASRVGPGLGRPPGRLALLRACPLRCSPSLPSGPGPGPVRGSHKTKNLEKSRPSVGAATPFVVFLLRGQIGAPPGPSTLCYLCSYLV